MLALGKHVICTYYSGHTEFVNEDVAHLVFPDAPEMAYDGVFFNGQVGEWATLGEEQIGQIVLWMRHFHKKKREEGGLSNPYGTEHMRQFTWERSASCLLEAVYGA